MKRLLVFIICVIMTARAGSADITPQTAETMHSSATLITGIKEMKEMEVENERLARFLEKKKSFKFKTVKLEAQRLKESGNKQFNKDGSIVKSHKGALGIAQFMPKTWNWMKRKGMIPKTMDIRNAEHQKKAQEVYMHYLVKYNYGKRSKGLDPEMLAVAAYNCGPGRVSKEIRKHGNNWREHIPSETKDYLIKLNY